ncbi:MAG: hypothetical protein ACLP9L_26970 [Thermoguttaceae bacterium]
MTLWRQWPSWIVLLCLGLMPAADANCLAADAPPPTYRAAAAPQKVEPARATPATKRGSLLETIVGALDDDRDGNKRRARAVQDQNIRNWEAQFRPQFQQLLYVELAFLRRVCKPDAKPFIEVAKAAKADLRVPLRRYVVAIYTPSNGPRGAASSANDPRSGIQKMLIPLVEAKLGPEKARLYREECDKRTEARKHAVVLNLVAALDERLVLTAQQRAKLVQSLSASYDNTWEQYCEMFAFNGFQYFPPMPDASIAPLLDETQKRVWEQTMKTNGRVFFGQVVMQGPLSGDAAETQEIARIIEEAQGDR